MIVPNFSYHPSPSGGPLRCRNVRKLNPIVHLTLEEEPRVSSLFYVSGGMRYVKSVQEGKYSTNSNRSASLDRAWFAPALVPFLDRNNCFMIEPEPTAKDSIHTVAWHCLPENER